MSEDEKKTKAEIEIEEMAEAYSKKWKVPVKEAKTKVKAFMEKKPAPGGTTDRTRVVPGMENLFPEPLGPLSTKLMDINQAALSTAFTRRSLVEMSQPPEELKGLREKMDSLEKTVGNVFEFVNTTVKEWKGELDVKRRDEERQRLYDDINEKVVQPLREKIETIEQAKGGSGAALTELTPEGVIKASQEVTENAKKWLANFGYNIEMPKALSKEQVESMLKEHGEKVKEDFDLEKESRLEEAKINAAEKVVNNSIDRVFSMFEPIIRDVVEGSIDRRAATDQPAPGAEQPPTPGAPPPVPGGKTEEWGAPLSPRFQEYTKKSEEEEKQT